jgi:hypothetical protein
MILSMKIILHVSTHSTLARVRISLLIAEMRIFELIVTMINESRSDCFHSMIFLTIMSIVSFSRISTWARIQWMWISRSHYSILRVSVCNKYWSDCFFEHWMTRITIWQFVKMIMKRFLRWISITFKVRSSLTISSK